VCRWRCRQKTIRAFSPFVILPPTIGQRDRRANVQVRSVSRSLDIILTLITSFVYGVCPERLRFPAWTSPNSGRKA
jgi:hypothetical protein